MTTFAWLELSPDQIYSIVRVEVRQFAKPVMGIILIAIFTGVNINFSFFNVRRLDFSSKFNVLFWGGSAFIDVLTFEFCNLAPTIILNGWLL
jgi:hypothetical protein